MWNGVKKAILENDRFLLTTHVSPDADGIGAASALIELLTHLQKEVYFLVDSPIPRKYRFLDPKKKMRRYLREEVYKPFDVCIILDAHTKERIGLVSELLEVQKPYTICIDHHRQREFGWDLCVIDENASCSGALIHSLLDEMGFSMTITALEGIYASVISDTGRFCNSSTGRKAHKIADECIKQGVDPEKMYERLFKQIEMKQVDLFCRALSSSSLHFDGRVFVQEISDGSYDLENIDLEHADLDFIHDFNGQIKGIEAFLLFRELPNQVVRVSMRSSKMFDAEKAMRFFGGGGHQRAAGALIHGPLDQVKERVLKKIGEIFAINRTSEL